jgi:hypothetical protein
MSNQQLHIDDYEIRSAGRITLYGAGEGITLTAGDEAGVINLVAQAGAIVGSGPANLTLENADEGAGGTATLQAGGEGQVKIGAGVPEVGASMVLLPEEITIRVGPPGVGASITMTPESITFRVAEVSFMLTPEGIVEEVAECSREHTPEGHNFTAAETELNVGVEGEAKEFPTEMQEVEGGTVQNETLGSHTSDALSNTDAGIAMTV